MCLGAGKWAAGAGSGEWVAWGEKVDEFKFDCWVHSSSLRRKVWVGNKGLATDLAEKVSIIIVDY